MCYEAYDQCACWKGTIEELVAYESAEEGRSDQQLYTYTSDLQALEACTSDTKSTLPVSQLQSPLLCKEIGGKTHYQTTQTECFPTTFP